MPKTPKLTEAQNDWRLVDMRGRDNYKCLSAKFKRSCAEMREHCGYTASSQLLDWLANGVAYCMLGSGYPYDYMASCINHVKEKYTKDPDFASILYDLHTLLETTVKHDNPFTERLEKLTQVLLCMER